MAFLNKKLEKTNNVSSHTLWLDYIVQGPLKQMDGKALNGPLMKKAKTCDLATWQFGNLTIWQLGNLATWQFGKTWQLGNLATWQLSILAIST